MIILFQDFLRQNNTGKLLWQVLGVQAATLCLYGIAEDEEIMWNAFKCAGFLLLFFFNCFSFQRFWVPVICRWQLITEFKCYLKASGVTFTLNISVIELKFI